MAIVKDLGRPESLIDVPLADAHTSRDSFAITPDDAVNFTKIPREIIVGTAGNIVVVKFDNSTVTIAAVAGQTITQICKRINATGTTATGLVGIV
jgi:hypothetical protein